MADQATQFRRSIGEHIAWILFCFTCFYVLFGIPSVRLISGERTPVFVGLLCAVTLIGALLFSGKKSLNGSIPEVVISLALLALALLSAAFSEAPESASVRALVLMSTALGGFWCARILLADISRQRAFAWLCAGVLLAWVAVGFSGLIVEAKITHYLQVNPHKVVGMLFLLSFAPLALLSRRTWAGIAAGLTLLVFLLTQLYLGGAIENVEAGVLIPMVMFGMAAVFVRKGSHAISVAIIVLLVVVGVASHYVYRVSHEKFTGETFKAYRVEAYPFSWHIVKKHPILGIGLRTPREKYLDDYEKLQEGLPDEALAGLVRRVVTPENAFLSFGTGAGIPFLAIYVFALVTLLVRLIRCTFRPPSDFAFSPLVLLIPISGGLLHAFMVDTLLYASMSWFFHIFLGLIPRHPGVVDNARLDLKTVGLRTVYVSVALVVGILIGTHQIFSIGVFPTAAEISRQAKMLPVLSLIFREQDNESKIESEIENRAASGSPQLRSVRSPASRDSQRSADSNDHKVASAGPKQVDSPALGSLLVEIEDYKGSLVKWALMAILNDSSTMGAGSENWSRGRLSEAVGFLKRLGEVLPPGSELAVRAFPDAIPLRMEGKTYSIRVSRILRDWSGPPFADAIQGLQGSHEGKTNPCAATIRAVQKDFGRIGNASPRLLILTDCRSDCSIDRVLGELNRSTAKQAVRVDVVVFGPRTGEPCRWAAVAEQSKGTFLKVVRPDEVERVLADYARILNIPRFAKIDISGKGKTYKIYPGEKIELPPGSYSLRLPKFGNLPDSSRILSSVQLEPGETRVLRVSLLDGKVHVR